MAIYNVSNLPKPVRVMRLVHDAKRRESYRAIYHRTKRKRSASVNHLIEYLSFVQWTQIRFHNLFVTPHNTTDKVVQFKHGGQTMFADMAAFSCGIRHLHIDDKHLTVISTNNKIKLFLDVMVAFWETFRVVPATPVSKERKFWRALQDHYYWTGDGTFLIYLQEAGWFQDVCKYGLWKVPSLGYPPGFVKLATKGGVRVGDYIGALPLNTAATYQNLKLPDAEWNCSYDLSKMAVPKEALSDAWTNSVYYQSLEEYREYSTAVWSRVP